MENLLSIRLGKCSMDADIKGFAAAGAIATSGKLLDLTRIYANVPWRQYDGGHRGYVSESILSTTLPIIEACRGYRTIVYMTSRRFSYSSHCADVLMKCRESKSNARTMVVMHTKDNVFRVTEKDTSSDMAADEVLSVVTGALGLPMSCAICDWEGVDLFDGMRKTTRATMWWYPSTLRNPLVSVAGDHSTAYYARAYGTRDAYCIMTGGYYNLADSTAEISGYATSRWEAYDMLLQSQTCINGECFSCTYLRACVARRGIMEKRTEGITLELLLDI